jgi:NADH-quinone oxidoreductase subunit N
VILLVGSLVGRRLPEWVWTTMSVLSAGVGGGCAIWLWNDVADEGARVGVAAAIAVDGFSVWFAIAMCVFVALFSLLAGSYVERERLGGPEIHVLALLSASGGILMAFANDLILLFLGLEILSIALYVLAGFHRRRAESGEAAIKYFVLGAFASAVFLYGVALVYGATGSTRLDQIVGFLTGRTAAAEGAGVESDERRLLLMGVMLLLVGLGFKVAAVPFHTWTPDVYQGAPSPVTGFMAAAAKAAGFAGLLRVFVGALSPVSDDWRPAVFGVATLTLVVGSVLAIVQTDVKRMLAYSSISHAGYVLVGVYAASQAGVAGSEYYLLTYGITALGSFAVVSVVGREGDGHHSLDDYKGLYQRRPTLAVAFALLLAAQAGVPFTTGFLAKFSVIRAATDADDYSLAIIAMLVTAVAAFFYLRLVLTMFTPIAEEDEEAEGGGAVALAVRAKAKAELEVPVGTAIVVGFSVLVTIGAGLWAGPLLDWAERATLLF